MAFPREAFLLGKQLKSLQITLQMERIFTQMLEIVKNYERNENYETNKLNKENKEFEENIENEENPYSNHDDAKNTFIQYLLESMKALRRMNSQMVPILQSLAEYAESIIIKGEIG
ncbi:MAG: hypothetical protein ACTSWC_05185 [Promethearchaeota archaeon]